MPKLYITILKHNEDVLPKNCKCLILKPMAQAYADL